MRINFPSVVKGVSSVVVSRTGEKPPDPPLPAQAVNALLSVATWDLGGFSVFAWHVGTLTALTSYGLSLSWLALVTK
jgi:hypothetical protein